MSKKRWILLISIFVLILAAVGGILYADSFPTGDSVIVWYHTGDAVVPMQIDNVVEVREYILYGERYQVVVYIRDAMVPEVFTPWEIVDYKMPLHSDIEFVTYTDTVYHTYDPYLQGWKNEQRKQFILDTYNECLGREPTEEEFNLALAIMIQKVQLEQWKIRLEHSPEAMVYQIDRLRDEPLTPTQQKRVTRMLERGESIETITGVFVG